MTKIIISTIIIIAGLIVLPASILTKTYLVIAALISYVCFRQIDKSSLRRKGFAKGWTAYALFVLIPFIYLITLTEGLVAQFFYIPVIALIIIPLFAREDKNK